MTGQLVQVKQPPNVCCQDVSKRGPVERLSEDLSFTRCTVCGRRHFEIEVEPGAVGMKGASL